MKYKVLGENIKHFRKNLRLTQKELGDKILKSEISIRKYESGTSNIPPATLTDICNVLKISPYDLLGSDLIAYINDNGDIHDILDKSRFNKANENRKNYSLEQYMYALGYEIIIDTAEGDIILKAPEGEYEITMNDLNDMTSSTDSFIKFKISEIINKSRKIGN
ncbi:MULTISPECIES: helix-turn-helix transcriptional regulator [unclassified Clostridium]|uniref:helix-turn-helix domain-containing protein n=1 Tax=unclassified Clostridium TaxID=2614128 RepID=UPI0032163D13